MSSKTLIRTRFRSVRLTPGELAILRGKARTAGLPLSTYLRQRALEHRVRAPGNRLDYEDVDQLAELGRRLNEFARAANTARRMVGTEDLRELLAEIRTVAREFRGKFPP